MEKKILLFVLFLVYYACFNAQTWERKPLNNLSFVEEKGQFEEYLNEIEVSIPEPIICGVENSEFNAYITKKGIYFLVSEMQKLTHDEKELLEKNQDKKHIPELEDLTHKAIWHKIAFKWKSNNSVSSKLNDKLSSYHSYQALNEENTNNFNFANEYKEITLNNIFDGCDITFSLPESGGIKYNLNVHSASSIPYVFYWENIESIKDSEQDDFIKISTNVTRNKESFFFTDKKPIAYTLNNQSKVEVNYEIKDSLIMYSFPTVPNEPVVIDPWIQNPNFPNLNKAYDIQTDAAGNVIVLGNYSSGSIQYNIQKYDPTGTLLWTYQYYSIFLGDIAVDNAGNIYHIGNYSTGRRVKLDQSAVQQWSVAGCSEEWRLAFNLDKSLLTVGGNFVTPNANLGQINMSTGVLNNQISYSEETRAITTDCSGDIYALTIPSGSTCNLRKISNYTLVNTVSAGFPVNYSGTGYAFNPAYNANVYQGFNGIYIDGNFVYIYNGSEVRKFNKSTLAFVSSFTPPNSSYMLCSGIAFDYCGNLYVGTTTGIAVYDNSLNYISTIATTGAVYDIILANDGNLLVSGNAFLGKFDITCTPPPVLSTTTTVQSCSPGAIQLTVSGGTPGYNYEWTDVNGNIIGTNSSLANLSSGTYNYLISDAFCSALTGTITIDPQPTSSILGDVNGVLGGAIPQCNDLPVQFNSTATVTGAGTITGWKWHFGFGDTIIGQNPVVTFPLDEYPNLTTYNVYLQTTTSDGCLHDTVVTYTPLPLPYPNYTYSNECVNKEVSYTNTSQIVAPATIASHLYNFGDVSPFSTVADPTHTFSTIGYYSTTLQETSSDGCVNDTTFFVTVYPEPVAAFSSSTVCENTPPTLLQDLSTISSGSISSVAWNFGTGSSTLNNPSYDFGSAGTYSVSLKVTSDFGCVDSVTSNVTVLPIPHAEFSLIDSCAYQNVVYTDASTIASPETIATWSWDVDNDGTEDYNIQNPSHLFAAGNHTSKLTVTSGNGCSKDTTMPVVIYPKPTADFTFTNKCLYDSIPFVDASTVSGTDVIAGTIWNFGENSLLSVDAQISNPYYTYSTVGTYTVSEIVTTLNGCLDTVTKQVEAYAVPVASFSIGNACLTVATAYTESATISNGSITNWNWDFGDLNYGTNQNETHTYASDGSYNVQLVVTSDHLCRDTMIQSLTVYPNPQVTFSMANNCLEEETDFTDNTIINTPGVLSNWIWDFGDASALDPSQNPTHTYQTEGIYNVKLIVVSADNCTDTLTQNVTVYPLPIVGFSATEICENTPPTVFTNTSAIASGANVGFAWSFGDVGGSTSMLENPSLDYGSHGNYDVTLAVVSDNGCSDTLTQTIKVKHIPNANFVQDTTGGCAPICVDFAGQSTDSIGIATWSWKFENAQGEGSNKYETYCYDNEGTFDVELMVMNTEGCFDVVTKPGLIKTFGYPTAEFELVPSQTTILDSDIEFINSSSDTLVWMWDFEDGTYDSLNYEPVHHYGDTGVYMVGLTIYNANGCSDVVYHQVIITPVENVFVPTAFSPNGDGENDVLYVRGYLGGLYFAVYDRWGKRVFETKDPRTGWDGTINGKQAVEGVYMWYLQTTINGEPKKLKGDVSLMR